MTPLGVVGAAVAASVLAGSGVGLIWSGRGDRPTGPSGRGDPRTGWPGRGDRPTGPSGRSRSSAPARASQGWASRRLPGGAGRPVVGAESATAIACAAVGGAAVGWILFGALVPALAVAAFGGTFPLAALRRRERERRAEAAGSWPRVLEEIRMRTGSLGRSIPQALWEAGRHVPDLWAPAFRSAEREWLLTTDLERTLGLLRHQLDDPTADVVCETLLIAHELGGTDLDARLADLIEDRVADAESRRDADSRLAGVRFARRFVLLVPLGMTVVGLTIGTGRAAYSSPGGQAAVLVGVVAVAACWWWSSRLMRLPAPPRIWR